MNNSDLKSVHLFQAVLEERLAELAKSWDVPVETDPGINEVRRGAQIGALGIIGFRLSRIQNGSPIEEHRETFEKFTAKDYDPALYGIEIKSDSAKYAQGKKLLKDFAHYLGATMIQRADMVALKKSAKPSDDGMSVIETHIQIDEIDWAAPTIPAELGQDKHARFEDEKKRMAEILRKASAVELDAYLKNTLRPRFAEVFYELREGRKAATTSNSFALKEMDLIDLQEALGNAIKHVLKVTKANDADLPPYPVLNEPIETVPAAAKVIAFAPRSLHSATTTRRTPPANLNDVPVLRDVLSAAATGAAKPAVAPTPTPTPAPAAPLLIEAVSPEAAKCREELDEIRPSRPLASRISNIRDATTIKFKDNGTEKSANRFGWVKTAAKYATVAVAATAAVAASIFVGVAMKIGYNDLTREARTMDAAAAHFNAAAEQQASAPLQTATIIVEKAANDKGSEPTVATLTDPAPMVAAVADVPPAPKAHKHVHSAKPKKDFKLATVQVNFDIVSEPIVQKPFDIMTMRSDLSTFSKACEKAGVSGPDTACATLAPGV